MTEQPVKKGMSKGCKVWLIVGLVLLVLLVGAIAVCMTYKDEIAKFGAVQIVKGVESKMIEEPLATIDSAQYNALADAFTQKLGDNELDYTKYQAFFAEIQAIPQDEKIDDEEIWIVVDAMIDYFPELEDLRPERLGESKMEEAMPDSSEMMEESTEDMSAE